MVIFTVAEEEDVKNQIQRGYADELKACFSEKAAVFNPDQAVCLVWPKTNSPKGVGVNVLPKGQNRLKNKVNSELKNGHFKEYLLEDI